MARLKSLIINDASKSLHSGSVLSVYGDTTVEGKIVAKSIQITGSDLSSDIGASAVADTTAYLQIDGAVVSSSLTVKGLAKVRQLEITGTEDDTYNGSSSTGDILRIDGGITATNITARNNLDVTGTTTLRGAISAKNNITIDSGKSLTNNGTTTLNGSTTLNGATNINASVTLAGDLTVAAKSPTKYKINLEEADVTLPNSITMKSASFTDLTVRRASTADGDGVIFRVNDKNDVSKIQINSNGAITATSVAANIDASNLTSGTIPEDRLANKGTNIGSFGQSSNAAPGFAGTFSVPYFTVDAKGRVTAASTKTITVPSTIAGSSLGLVKPGSTSGQTYGIAVNSSTGAMTVDVPWTDEKVKNTLNTTTKAYLVGTTSATTSTNGLIFDTGVYLDTTAGKLTATSFKGNGSELTNLNANSLPNIPYAKLPVGTTSTSVSRGDHTHSTSIAPLTGLRCYKCKLSDNISIWKWLYYYSWWNIILLYNAGFRYNC